MPGSTLTRASVLQGIDSGGYDCLPGLQSGDDAGVAVAVDVVGGYRPSLYLTLTYHPDADGASVLEEGGGRNADRAVLVSAVLDADSGADAGVGQGPVRGRQEGVAGGEELVEIGLLGYVYEPELKCLSGIDVHGAPAADGLVDVDEVIYGYVYLHNRGAVADEGDYRHTGPDRLAGLEVHLLDVAVEWCEHLGVIEGVLVGAVEGGYLLQAVAGLVVVVLSGTASVREFDDPAGLGLDLLVLGGGGGQLNGVVALLYLGQCVSLTDVLPLAEVYGGYRTGNPE